MTGMQTHAPQLMETTDGRRLEFLTGGQGDGFPLLFHGGTPSAVVAYPPLWEAAARAGLRLVTISRPGYGASTPRTVTAAPPTMLDDAADAVAVLDHLGFDDFVTLGWSGGGPRSLACAAAFPERCRAAASLAGVAPYGVDGLAWLDGMGPENVRDFTLALEGRDAVRPVLEEEIAGLAAVTGEQIVEAFGGLVDEVDAAALTGDFGDYVAATFRRSAEQGVAGILEDTLQVVRPWGFDLSDLTVPVSIWQGAHDRMVPYGHGRWLADAVPGARAHLFDDEGHLSLVARVDEILAELRQAAGLGG
jgi:pimeloyl-ACP methyl ester carboxylesterase